MMRKILHLDLDAFFCAVEEQRNPALRNKAFAVGGKPEERGVVASCSYPARYYGVRSAMPMSRAIRLCPALLIVPAHHGLYSQISKQVMERLENLSPLVEQISIDEAFLDVSDLPEPGEQIARRLQATIQDELGLPCSLGVATNKLIAKTANDVGKAAGRAAHKAAGDVGPPNAITIVPPGQEAGFLAPLPVEALWGVGPKTTERLAEIGIRTIGELAQQSPVYLGRLFGKLGEELALRAQGIDEREIITSHAIKSISQETTFVKDVRDEEILRRTLRTLSEGVGKRLRQHHLLGGTVKLKLRWADFTTLTRQATLDQPTDQDNQVFALAEQLLRKNWPKNQPVRLIGVGVGGLGPPIRQLSLWDNYLPVASPTTKDFGNEKDRRLQEAVDELRERYGEQILHLGMHHKPD